MKQSRSLNQCTHCHGKFGLVRYPDRFFRGTFCSQACRYRFIFKRQQEIEHYRRWIGHLPRLSGPDHPISGPRSAAVPKVIPSPSNVLVCPGGASP